MPITSLFNKKNLDMILFIKKSTYVNLLLLHSNTNFNTKMIKFTLPIVFLILIQTYFHKLNILINMIIIIIKFYKLNKPVNHLWDYLYLF
jgi:hypothetical protein